MRPLSLAIKLNILIAATFATIFAFNIATLANRVHAGFQMEMKSNLKLAQELAKMEIVNGRDPMTLLRQVFGDPEYRRRVDLRVIWSGSASRPPIETLTLLDKNLENSAMVLRAHFPSAAGPTYSRHGARDDEVWRY